MQTKGSLENGSPSGFCRAATCARSSLMVWSFVTRFGGCLALIPAFFFAAAVITGAAGWVDLFFVRVEATMARRNVRRKRVSSVPDGTNR